MPKGIYKKTKNHKWKLGLPYRGKTYEEIYGVEKAKIEKKKRSEGHMGLKLSKETKKKISKSNKNKILSKETIEKIKQARKKQITPIKDTSIEIKLQNFLKELNIKFEKHKYVNIEHGYQCDIYIPSLNLIIEADGVYWHNYPKGNELDHIRTQEMYEEGYNVLRLWEIDIKNMDLNEFKNKLHNIKND